MMRWADGVDAAGGWMVICGAGVGVVLLVCTIALIRTNYRDREPLPDVERELQLRLAREEIDLNGFFRERAALRR